MEDIYVLAHEIKNPLSVAKGYLEMIDKENLDKYKDIIINEINMSLEILDSYLEYNKLSINKEEVDINLFLQDIKENLSLYLKNNNVNLNLYLEDDDIYIQLDYNKLKQVFYNIIKNSVESHSKNINIKYELLDRKINIVISNDGDKSDNVDKIGNDFSSKVFGNGIGIKLSKRIVELHGGDVMYYNNKDGVSCKITLPI